MSWSISPPPPPPSSLLVDALANALAVVFLGALVFRFLSAPGDTKGTSKVRKPRPRATLENDAGDAGSDSESEPSVVASEDQCLDDDDNEEHDAEGYFCDRAFPPGLDSLGNMTGDSANKAKGKVDKWQAEMLPGWARPHQMMGEKRTQTHGLYGMDDVQPRLFGHTAPNDLRQGSIGDCWLITAMSSISEYPSLVQRLFKQQELASDGRYDVRLYDQETEAWHVVTIDDRLPFIKSPGYYGRTLFCKPSLEGEFWPCLLEKAFAKFLDGYWRLEGGFIGVALAALTGKPSVYLSIGQGDDAHTSSDFFYGAEWENSSKKCLLMRNPGKDKGWSTWAADLEPEVWDAVGEEPISEIDDEGLWERLVVWDALGYIMGASSRGNYQGVLGGHAYSIISAVEVEVEGHEYPTLRMLKIRNPHAGNEWTGPFSDADGDSWNAHPEALEACAHEVGEAEDGFFWMPFDEFKNGFKKFHLNFQPNKTEGGGSELPRYDQVELGHTFSDEELEVSGHAWDGEPAEDDLDSEADIDVATGGGGDEIEEQIIGLVGNIKTLWTDLKDLPPGEDRKAVLKSISRKGRRLAAAWVNS
jgi:hypothetical protein